MEKKGMTEVDLSYLIPDCIRRDRVTFPSSGIVLSWSPPPDYQDDRHVFLELGDFQLRLNSQPDRLLALFVDDDHAPVRAPPADGRTWIRAYNFMQALLLLESVQFDHVSLDHDIRSVYGSRELTGRDLLTWLIDRKLNTELYVPRTVVVHSQNCVGASTMEADCARYFPK